MPFWGLIGLWTGGDMHVGRLVFAQIMDLLPLPDFRRCAARYPERRPSRKFSCLDQFLCMAFAQLTTRESLRDIESCLRAVPTKLYHLGIRGSVCRTTLVDNLWITSKSVVRQLAEAEMERGGWCIIGVLSHNGMAFHIMKLSL